MTNPPVTEEAVERDRERQITLSAMHKHDGGDEALLFNYGWDAATKFAALTKSPPVTVSEVELLEVEILRLVDALSFAHDAGFEWPVDPLPFGSIAHNLFIERGNERISE